MDWARVAEVLPRKCAHGQVAIASIADIFAPPLLAEVRAICLPWLSAQLTVWMANGSGEK